MGTNTQRNAQKESSVKRSTPPEASKSDTFNLLTGEPAGGAALGFRKGIASLSGATTLPEFRNRGVQTALLQTRLARGKAKGLRIGDEHCASWKRLASQHRAARISRSYRRAKVQKGKRA